jgi:hypothetical protein
MLGVKQHFQAVAAADRATIAALQDEVGQLREQIASLQVRLDDVRHAGGC